MHIYLYKSLFLFLFFFPQNILFESDFHPTIGTFKKSPLFFKDICVHDRGSGGNLIVWGFYQNQMALWTFCLYNFMVLQFRFYEFAFLLLLADLQWHCKEMHTCALLRTQELHPMMRQEWTTRRLFLLWCTLMVLL